jgi:SRSO17 transposase
MLARQWRLGVKMVNKVDYNDEYFREFCRDLFGSLSRSDQRRCAEVYLRGLIYGKGRKSPQRIAEQISGPHSGQSLQQFINQSPWDPQEVRRRGVDLLAKHVEPTAWVVEEAVFLKHGYFSAGVERQYVHSLGRVANCQVGVTMMLTNSELSVPINWRLCLPESWDTDDKRRSRAHIPPEARHRTYLEYLVNLVDDVTVDWGVTDAPIVSDASQAMETEPYLYELERRSLDYLVKVNDRQLIRSWVAAHQQNGVLTQFGQSTRVVRLSGIAQLAARAERRTVAWREGPEGRPRRSQFLTIPVDPVTPRAHNGNGVVRGSRQLLVDWPFGRSKPRAFWLTNMVGRPVDELVVLASLRWRAAQTMGELADQFGLYHHEGRSFLGWHHHVTLVSAAYAFHVREQLRRSVEVVVDDGARSAS